MKDYYENLIVDFLQKYGPSEFSVINRFILDQESDKFSCPTSGLVNSILRYHEKTEKRGKLWYLVE